LLQRRISLGEQGSATLGDSLPVPPPEKKKTNQTTSLSLTDQDSAGSDLISRVSAHPRHSLPFNRRRRGRGAARDTTIHVTSHILSVFARNCQTQTHRVSRGGISAFARVTNFCHGRYRHAAPNPSSSGLCILYCPFPPLRTRRFDDSLRTAVSSIIPGLSSSDGARVSTESAKTIT
jgi:hypothetical protein